MPGQCISALTALCNSVLVFVIYLVTSHFTDGASPVSGTVNHGYQIKIHRPYSHAVNLTVFTSLQRTAFLSVPLSVRTSVHASHAGIVSK